MFPTEKDVRFDRRLAVVRRVSWFVAAPLLIFGAVRVTATGTGIAHSSVRAAMIYGFVLLVLRLAGKRTMAQITTFDLVILLILSEAIQPAMVGDGSSMLNAFVIVGTLVAIDVALGVGKDRSPTLARWLDDVPTVLIREGVADEAAMRRVRVDLGDVMESARLHQGIMDRAQVRYAILERTGGISIIPWGGGADERR